MKAHAHTYIYLVCHVSTDVSRWFFLIWRRCTSSAYSLSASDFFFLLSFWYALFVDTTLSASSVTWCSSSLMRCSFTSVHWLNSSMTRCIFCAAKLAESSAARTAFFDTYCSLRTCLPNRFTSRPRSLAIEALSFASFLNWGCACSVLLGSEWVSGHGCNRLPLKVMFVVPWREPPRDCTFW